MANACPVDLDGYDCFRGTSKEGVARTFGVIGVNVYARKPDVR
jgi:hypothetical protein